LSPSDNIIAKQNTSIRLIVHDTIFAVILVIIADTGRVPGGQR